MVSNTDQRYGVRIWGCQKFELSRHRSRPNLLVFRWLGLTLSQDNILCRFINNDHGVRVAYSIRVWCAWKKKIPRSRILGVSSVPTNESVLVMISGYNWPWPTISSYVCFSANGRGPRISTKSSFCICSLSRSRSASWNQIYWERVTERTKLEFGSRQICRCRVQMPINEHDQILKTPRRSD